MDGGLNNGIDYIRSSQQAKQRLKQASALYI